MTKFTMLNWVSRGGGARCVVCALFAALLSLTTISAKADLLKAMSEKEFLSYYYTETGQEVMLARSLEAGWILKNKDTLYSQLLDNNTTRDRIPATEQNGALNIAALGRNRSSTTASANYFVFSGYDDNRLWGSFAQGSTNPYAAGGKGATTTATWGVTSGSMAGVKFTMKNVSTSVEDIVTFGKPGKSLGQKSYSNTSTSLGIANYFGGKELEWFAIDLRGITASVLTYTGGTAGFGDDTFDVDSLVFGQLNFFAIDATLMPESATLEFNLGDIKIASGNNYNFFSIQVGTLQEATWEYSVLNSDSIYYDASLVPPAAETPEPATLLILGLGLAGLGLARRRK